MRKTLLSLSMIAIAINGWSIEKKEGLKEIVCEMKPWSRPKNLEKKSTLNEKFTTDVGSTNWCGYVAMADTNQVNSVVAVEGEWTVPVLSPTPDNSYCAVWVGIDGFSSDTVEQLGTSSDWSNGEQSNYAWIEMFPNPSFALSNFPVNPGDTIYAYVEYVGNGVFDMYMANYTQGVYTTIPTDYTTNAGAQRTSVEWIVEAPWSGSILPLSDFNPITMTYCYGAINGLEGGINDSGWENDQITMNTGSGQPKAVPSALFNNGTSFQVVWDHE